MEASTLALSPNGQTLATGSRDADVRLWNTRTGKLAHTLSGHTDQVIAVALSPDDQQVYSAARNGEILNWQVASGKLLGRTKPNRDRPGLISAVAISPNTRLIASNISGQAIVLRNLRTGQGLRNLKGYSEAEQSLAFSADGRLLVSSAIAGATTLWNLQTGKVIRSFLTDQDFAVPTLTRALAISPDQRSLATGTWNGEIILKDITTGEPLKVLHAHAGIVQVLLFNTDGNVLVSGGSDGLIKVWQLPSGRLQQTLVGTKTEILSLALSRNGQVLASASQDGQVNLWQLKSGQYLPSLP
jgi:WD40 repeat protein